VKHLQSLVRVGLTRQLSHRRRIGTATAAAATPAVVSGADSSSVTQDTISANADANANANANANAAVSPPGSSTPTTLPGADAAIAQVDAAADGNPSAVADDDVARDAANNAIRLEIVKKYVAVGVLVLVLVFGGGRLCCSELAFANVLVVLRLWMLVLT